MTKLDHIEEYEFLEAKHRRSRLINLAATVFIVMVGLSNNFFDSTTVLGSERENYFVLVIGLIFTVHLIRTWNGSDELKFLRELFR